MERFPSDLLETSVDPDTDVKDNSVLADQDKISSTNVKHKLGSVTSIELESTFDQNLDVIDDHLHQPTSDTQHETQLIEKEEATRTTIKSCTDSEKSHEKITHDFSSNEKTEALSDVYTKHDYIKSTEDELVENVKCAGNSNIYITTNTKDITNLNETQACLIKQNTSKETYLPNGRKDGDVLLTSSKKIIDMDISRNSSSLTNYESKLHQPDAGQSFVTNIEVIKIVFLLTLLFNLKSNPHSQTKNHLH